MHDSVLVDPLFQRMLFQSVPSNTRSCRARSAGAGAHRRPDSLILDDAPVAGFGTTERPWRQKSVRPNFDRQWQRQVLPSGGHHQRPVVPRPSSRTPSGSLRSRSPNSPRRCSRLPSRVISGKLDRCESSEEMAEPSYSYAKARMPVCKAMPKPLDPFRFLLMAGWMNHPARKRNRVLARREPSASLSTRQPATSLHRRPASQSGCKGQPARTNAVGRSGHGCHT
jgi:hypothetical protein